MILFGAIFIAGIFLGITIYIVSFNHGYNIARASCIKTIEDTFRKEVEKLKETKSSSLSDSSGSDS